ncbi:MAG: FAD-dependent oxidoreductase [Capsulimonadaceae bacterium]|nr:FAD-dependent oxidoreductase [Capsulimonadaceae bacterium]
MTYDIVIAGATPGGICAAVAAARCGRHVLLLERTDHIGGLPANGLGATDIGTRGATAGLFLEFVTRVKEYYIALYGEASQQVKDCSDGYHFEPHVAEQVFENMVAGEGDHIRVLRGRQLDARPDRVCLDAKRSLRSVTVLDRATGALETYEAKVFIDATYEGDLAAAAGCRFETRREGKSEYGEPFAGRVYRPWGAGPLGEGSTEEGDDTLQAYNYRLCLTSDPNIRVPIDKPSNYNRVDYASLIGDVRSGSMEHFMPGKKGARDIGIVNPVALPNGKTDSNNHHASFLSTDLPEENWPYPSADWEWRDRFAQRLRDYTLGLLWFCQNDPELPEWFRAEAREWGLAAGEYTDNDHFPRQIYVREGRRIIGEYLFTALDAIAPEDVDRAYRIMEGVEEASRDKRPPSKLDSVTASHYPLDSHAVRKREPGKVHLDGFLGLGMISRQYQAPYGVMVPLDIDGVLTPVPCSATHLGFSTLRMEPCWMALGHAAGVAAHVAIDQGTTVRRVDIARVQDLLLKQNQTLTYFRDVPRTHPHWTALQKAGCLGLFDTYDAHPDDAIDQDAATALALRAQLPTGAAHWRDGQTVGEFVSALIGSA